MTTLPDFRALCAKLAKKLQEKHAFLCRIEGDDCSEHPLVASSLAALEAVPATPAPVPVASLNIVFDGPPGPEGGRFVEVETDDGLSINAGEWSQRPDGLWSLRITSPAPVPVAERLPEAGDFDGEGYCWLYGWGMDPIGWHYQKPDDETLGYYEPTHWLPHWALPLPEVQP